MEEIKAYAHDPNSPIADRHVRHDHGCAYGYEAQLGQLNFFRICRSWTGRDEKVACTNNKGDRELETLLIFIYFLSNQCKIASRGHSDQDSRHVCWPAGTYYK